jgi:hypothetical protein
MISGTTSRIRVRLERGFVNGMSKSFPAEEIIGVTAQKGIPESSSQDKPFG